MQVSTRTEDYLVDTIALRSQLHILNTSFTNPAILKVVIRRCFFLLIPSMG